MKLKCVKSLPFGTESGALVMFEEAGGVQTVIFTGQPPEFARKFTVGREYDVPEPTELHNPDKGDAGGEQQEAV